MASAGVNKLDRRARLVRRGSWAMVALVLVLASPVVVSIKVDAAAVTTPARMWERVDLDRAGFGSHGAPDVIRAGGPGFVATGVLDRRERNPRSAIWTSTTGRNWSLVPTKDTGLDRRDELTGLATRGHITVATTSTSKVIRSRDGRRWSGPAKLRGATRERFTQRLLFPGPRGFVAVEVGDKPTWTKPTWTSRDGRHWTKSYAIGSVDHPVGLFPRTPWREEWVSVSTPSLDVTADVRAVYSSADGVRWTKISDAAVLQPLAPQIRATHDRQSLLAIQYEQVGKLDGRLWTSRDSFTWTEIKSFHAAMPTGRPDHLIQSGRWWVLGGYTGPRGEHPDMWASPDLQRWYELPAPLRSTGRSSQVAVIAAHRRVLGFAVADPTRRRSTPRLWIWRRPT